MADLKEMCLIDCRERIATYMASESGVTREDMNALLVAAATAAVDGVYADPVLEIGSALKPVRASVIAGSLRSYIHDAMQPVVSKLIHAAGEYQEIKASARLEGDLVIVNLDLIDEGD